jgi:uncharacterized protein (TIGR00369 family)
VLLAVHDVEVAVLVVVAQIAGVEPAPSVLLREVDALLADQKFDVPRWAYAGSRSRNRMAEFDADAARAFIQSYIDDHGFLAFLDMQVVELEAGRMVLRVPYDEKLTNHGPGQGNVHGGIAATLIDTAGGLAVRTALDDPVQAGVATIDLNVSYLRPARGDLVAEADVVRVGSTVGVAEVTVESDPGDGDVQEVAVGRGSFRVFGGDES